MVLGTVVGVVPLVELDGGLIVCVGMIPMLDEWLLMLVSVVPEAEAAGGVAVLGVMCGTSSWLPCVVPSERWRFTTMAGGLASAECGSPHFRRYKLPLW